MTGSQILLLIASFIILSAVIKYDEKRKQTSAQRELLASQQEQSEIKRQQLQQPHGQFANALGACLKSNWKKYGLIEPMRVEDVLCDNDADDICINGQNLPDFVYEVERGVSLVGIRDIGENAGVPVEDIEQDLKRTLPNTKI